MSQLADLNPLDTVHEADQSDYLMMAQVIEDALTMLGQNKPNVDDYPSFYDDALQRLIDLVPLE